MKKTSVLYFIISFVTWLALSMNSKVETIIIGFLASAITALIFGNMFTNIPVHVKPASIYWMGIYVFQILFDLTKSVIFSSYRVIAVPTSAESLSKDITVKTNIKSRFGMMLLSNAVTLSPLMLSTDFDRETGLLHLNCFSAETNIQNKAAKIVSKYENILLKFLK